MGGFGFRASRLWSVCAACEIANKYGRTEEKELEPESETEGLVLRHFQGKLSLEKAKNNL